jgi:hypothetical protein
MFWGDRVLAVNLIHQPRKAFGVQNLSQSGAVQLTHRQF